MESSVRQEPTTPPAAGPAPERDRNIAFVCAVLLLIGMPVGYRPGSTGDAVGLIVLGLFSLALMAGLLLWLAPRERAAGRDSRTGLILGILAVLTFVVFWTGIPFALGAAAMVLGLSALAAAAASGGRGQATAAVVLGALAVLASFVVLLIG